MGSGVSCLLFPGNPFWQREYWDRFIRDQNHYESAINYIHDNPVNVGLSESRNSWKFSSAFNFN